MDTVEIKMGLTLEEVKNKYIASCLQYYNNNKSLTAKVLKMGRASLYRLLKTIKTEDVFINRNVVKQKALCYICGSSEMLEGHHVIPQKDLITNKDLNNCIIVCNDCHIKLHNLVNALTFTRSVSQ